ncbi:hypothetical protein EJ04DRAFT_3558 [Polyplosphaeria fusca]|uniref:Uncharacterized protein n=1 Tax=Polyplosphaeria fusca TaxID=682080 RepID=A0A9P4RC49_9PLEO|nr:hypothetical protein EJ04DRAFT_3558 [Polyplosphaeria fusca]
MITKTICLRVPTTLRVEHLFWLILLLPPFLTHVLIPLSEPLQLIRYLQQFDEFQPALPVALGFLFLYRGPLETNVPCPVQVNIWLLQDIWFRVQPRAGAMDLRFAGVQVMGFCPWGRMVQE